MSTSNQLGEEKISKLLLSFSIPAIVAMVVNAIYNIVDRVFIGRVVGSDAFAGAFVVFPIILILMAIGSLSGFGGAALTSIRLGQKREEEAKFILGNAFIILVISGIVFTAVLLIFPEPILKFFGAKDKVLPHSKEYLRYLAFGFPFQMLGFGLNNFVRAIGKPKLAMTSMLSGAIVNIILDALFIYFMGLGIKGAAIATAIAQIIAFLIVFIFFISEKNTEMRLEIAYMTPQFCIIKKILALGMTQFSIQLLNSIITLIYNRVLSETGGAIAISTYGIINSILTIIILPVFGINQGSQPIVGYNYGAKNYKRVKDTLKLAIGVATIFTSIGFILTQFFTKSIVGLFTKNPELLKTADHGVKLFFLSFIIVGFQIVSSNYFQAKGLPMKSFIMSISRQGLILVPALLILSRKYGLNGIWYAAPLSDVLAAILTGIFLFFDLKDMNRKMLEEK
ncbi:MAG: MATE family efflux transporter [Andreesenia angusta]|nr:MATE family efflux transporter [Andreesenia angusta]